MDESISLAAAFKFCPRCAEPNPTPGSAPFRCSNCDFTSFFGPVLAVGGIIVRQGSDGKEMLFLQRARAPGRGKWGLPGGFVDCGESAEQALQREILEETGLAAEEFSYVTSASQLVRLPRRGRTCHRCVLSRACDKEHTHYAGKRRTQ